MPEQVRHDGWVAPGLGESARIPYRHPQPTDVYHPLTIDPQKGTQRGAAA
jgi:hypothetical protein